jgi:flavin-dependent dehydrogenase
MSEAVYDVVIVGGRIAGASLALRLGAAGLSVLVLEHASFPSRPAVSAPFLLPHAMALLDELGVDERTYAAGTPQLRRFVLEVSDYFRSELRFEHAVGDRTHFYAIDRAKLDTCLWRALARESTVTAYSAARFSGVDLAADGGMHSVRFKHDKRDHVVQARAVVGADGRYSPVAASVGAKVQHARQDVETSLYYAHWRGVSDYDSATGDAAHIHTSCDGFSFVFMPSANGETMVVAQGRSDSYLAQPGTPQQVYLRLLSERPRVQRRLERAEQVGSLSGIKHMGNLFRQSYGPGWALVGDAYHQKDSLDAQGIFDALLGAKLLAAALVAWRNGRAWNDALASYDADVWAALKPMFDATVARLQRELYSVPPPLLARSVLRYVLTHPAYAERFARVATRTLAPDQLLPPHELLKLAASGALRHGKRRLLYPAAYDPTDPL